MGDLYETLKLAKAELTLINIYQTDSDDFYTGIVSAVDDMSVILETYNENGIKDGFVLIQLSAISEIETASADLESMQFRIKTARQQHFLMPSFLYRVLSFDVYTPLIQQVLALTYQERQMVLLALAKDDNYYEGIITTFGSILKFDYFNRFDYSHSRKLAIDVDKIEVIEFGGLDLYLGKQLYLSQPKHEPLVRIKAGDFLEPYLQKAQAENILISVVPKNVENNFFVGYVTRVDDQGVLLTLMDMTGQFGGYALLRLSEIAEIAAISDYIHTIHFYEEANRVRGLLIQPVLQQNWPIGSKDVWGQTLQYAQDHHHLLRLRFHSDSGNSYLGNISKFDGQQFTFTSVDEEDSEDVLKIDVSDCLEIAFDYLNSYLLEQESQKY